MVLQVVPFYKGLNQEWTFEEFWTQGSLRKSDFILNKKIPIKNCHFTQQKAEIEWPLTPIPQISILGKEYTGVTFINILRAHFTYQSLLSSFSLLKVWLWANFRTKNVRVKCWWNWPLPSLFRSTQLIFLEIFFCSIFKSMKKFSQKIFIRNGSFATSETTFECPTVILA